MNKKSDNIPDQFFSNSINLIWIADNDGFFIQVNSEWEQILGYSSSQLTGKRFSDFVHPDEVEETDRIIRLAHTQPVHNFRNRFKHQDGSFHWLEWNSLSSGNLIFASARDITYYEKTKNAIKESKSGLYSFIDRSSEGIVITDEQGVIEAWNKSAELITGMPREDTYGKYCWDVAYSFFQEPEQGSLVREDINKELFNALTTGQLDIQSDDFHRIQLSDGKFKYVKHKVFTFKTDFGFRIGIVFTDITEHLTLKESEEKYRTLVENMEDAVFRADLNGVINFTNPSAARLLGCPSPKSIIGLKINDFLYYPDDSIKQYNALKEKGKLSKYEVTLKRMDNGNPVLVLANTQFYRDAKDQIIGIEGVYNEITERKKVEEALQKRVLALTKPIDDPEGVKFTDLFDLEELQKVQDTFSDATGVASIITYPDGTTITKPSNFCRLCNLIRSTEKGISDCLKSDVLIGEQSFNRPAIQPCLSGGLLNAGANITIGGKHVANWLIGQIRNEVQDENKVLEYAYAIGADPEQFKEALQEVPSMSEEQFEKVAQSLYVLANQLSLKAYQNVQQARFIAGQKKAEQELATAKAVLDTAFTQTPIPMILVYHTKKKNNLHVKNKASDELLGQLTETNYHGRTISKMNITWQFYDEFGNYVPHINTPIVMALNGTETKNKIFSIKRSDGTLRWTSVSATPIRNNAGEIIGAFQIFPDITVRKTAEEKVKQLAEMHQTILDTITTGLTFMKNRKHIWVNAACCKIFGYKIEEIVNVGSSYMFASKEDYEKVGVEGYKELGKGNIYSEEFQLKKKDGKLFWGRIVGKALNPNDISEGAIWMIEDINERKKAEENIRQLNADLEKKVYERTIQLEQANRDLEAFAYSVSHDLRAPIRHINGFVKLMYSKIPDPVESIVEYYSKIEASSRRMSSMIDSLLSFSRLGRKELSLTTTNMQTIVNEIIEDMEPDIEKRSIKWNISQLPSLKCDKTLMKLAFENLISNAVKYTKDQENAIITIGWNQINDKLIEFFIKDNGVGFDMAYSNKLFNVFQRLHTSEEFKGIGIGLANVRQIIEKHKGTVRAEGKLNEGAVFYITLPV